MNLSNNSNDDGFKDESQQMFKELFQTGNKGKEAKAAMQEKQLAKTKSKAELQPAKNKFQSSSVQHEVSDYDGIEDEINFDNKEN